MKNSLKPNNVIWVLLCVIVLFGLNTCKKPNTGNSNPVVNVKDTDSCFNIHYTEAMDGNNTGPKLGFAMPCYNPLNNNEFSFLQGDDSTFQTSLCTYNKATGAKHLLISGANGTQQPIWCSSGWIVFIKAGQIWKIRSDGTMPVQITNAPNGVYFPACSPDGQKIIFRYGESSTIAHTRIIDINGNFIRDLDSFSYTFAWAPDGYDISGTNWNGWCILNLNTGQYTTTPYFNRCWFPDQISWITDDTANTYIYNSQKHNLVVLKHSCVSRKYNSFSVSNDGKYIISDRMDRHLASPTSIYTAINIVIMKTDGSGEHIIDIK